MENENAIVNIPFSRSNDWLLKKMKDVQLVFTLIETCQLSH